MLQLASRASSEKMAAVGPSAATRPSRNTMVLAQTSSTRSRSCVATIFVCSKERSSSMSCRLPHDEHDGGGHESLDDPDGQVDGLHQQEERGRRELRPAGEHRLEDDAERAQLKPDHAGRDRRGGKAPARRARPCQRAVHEGKATKLVKKPRLRMLHPRASRPPSPKKRACTAGTETMTGNAAEGPIRIARRSPPPRCPLDPVPGMAKLTIWAAKTNAPSTPMRGTRRSSGSFLSARGQAGEARGGGPHGARHPGRDECVGHVHGGGPPRSINWRCVAPTGGRDKARGPARRADGGVERRRAG